MPALNNDQADLLALAERVSLLDFTYNDVTHVYMFDGRRCASFTAKAKHLSDSYNLELYDRRQVITGLALDPNLVENAAAHLSDNNYLNDIAGKAREVAGAHRKADRGTQGHVASEMVDLDVDLITAQQHEDAERYRRTCEAYDIDMPAEYVEVIGLFPDNHLCGRLDRIGTVGSSGLAVVDLKTGYNAIKYPHSTMVQLGLCATAPLIQAERRKTADGIEHTDRWRPMPDIRRDVAYVMYLPVGPEADEVGTLYEFRLDGQYGGSVAARAACWQREFWRACPEPRRITAPMKPAPPEPLPEPDNVVPIRSDFEHAKALGELRAQLDALSDEHKMALRPLWHEHGLPNLRGSFTHAELTTAKFLVDGLDPFQQHTEPEPDSRDRHPSNAAPRWNPDEGGDADVEAALTVSKLYYSLPDDVRARVDAAQTEAQQHGCGFHAADGASWRTVWLINATCYLAANDALDADSVRLVVASAVDADWPFDERLTVGAVIGLCHGAEAEAVLDLAIEFVNGEVIVEGNRLIKPQQQ